MTKEEFALTVNEWAAKQIPFLFIVDFELQIPIALRLDQLSKEEMLFNINGFANETGSKKVVPAIIEKQPISFEEYLQRFNIVSQHLHYGDSYLVNLTSKTPVTLSHSLQEIYYSVHAPYKLLYQDRFLVFSPESFVRIENGAIYSFPMKGTIDAAVPNAEAVILSDTKELAEHVTIVDLIRNDVSQVADNVQVTRFRYVERIKTREKDLLQVSSEIKGALPKGYQSRLGDILLSLLPAGSVSGAPKAKTIEIIRKAEIEKRGFYTGVFGYFNGERLDSGVMIRFIEHVDGRFFYRSGGGITTQSVARNEYQESIDKVYVPVD